MLESIKKIKINLTVATNYFDTIQGKEALTELVISGQIDLNFHKSKKSKAATQTVTIVEENVSAKNTLD